MLTKWQFVSGYVWFAQADSARPIGRFQVSLPLSSSRTTCRFCIISLSEYN